MSTEEDLEVEPRCGFDVCMPTPGLTLTEKLWGGAAEVWKPLCTPTYPCKKGAKPPPFFGKDSKPALFVTLMMGFQHMLAMLGGVITPPRLMANEGCLLGRDPDLCKMTPYLISSAMIASGLLTIVQVIRIKLAGGYFLGTGLISVMGPSFTFLPIGQILIGEEIAAGNPGTEAYGKFLGTCLVCSLLEVAMSFIPPQVLRKMFPPIVTGTTVFCIGAALTATGFQYWGGGVFCSQNAMTRPMEAASLGNRFILAPQSCQGDNGGEGFNPVDLDPYPAAKAPPGLVGADRYFGDSLYVGWGFLVLLFFTLIEMFGAPFMRNCNVALSLLLTYAFSACWVGEPVVSMGNTYEQKLVTGMFMHQTSKNTPVSFLWNGIVGTPDFAFGFAPEYVVPIMIAFVVSTVETIGDITASSIASRIPIEGGASKTFMSRVQGGLLADGVNSFLAALFCTPPNTTFSQNNGVISITGCASRAVGLACAGWLIFLGIFVPVGAFFADIPICVLGGMVTILFCSIMVGGIKVINMAPKTRRTHVILAVSLGFALGVTTVPNFVRGGGVSNGGRAAFYGSVLDMNTGLWPMKKLCKEGTQVYFSSDFPAGGPFGDYFASTDLDHPYPGMSNLTNGIHRGKYLMNPNDWVKSCETSKTDRSLRLALLIMLGTPYCIGFLMAFLLNLLLPEDAHETEGEGEQDGYNSTEAATTTTKATEASSV